MDEVWAYLRVSTLKVEQEESLDEQERRAETFARDESLRLRIFREQASAKSLVARPVLSGLMVELENRPPRDRPRFLFVTAEDRLARDMADSIYIAQRLRERKVRLYVDGKGVVSIDTFAQRAAYVGASLGGDAENEAKSKRMRDSWARRRSQGKPTSNKHPYGLQLVNEQDTATPGSSEWVLKAFEWYGAGEGCQVIARRFASGAPNHVWKTSKVGSDGQIVWKTRETQWEPLRVVKLLRQRRYRGVIVPPALFDEVADRLDKIPKTASVRIREYPLTAAMRCATCKRRLHGRANGGNSSYRLADGTHVRKKRPLTRYYGCGVCNFLVNAEVLEARFFEQIGRIVASEELLAQWVATPRMGLSHAQALRREANLLENETNATVVNRQRDRLVDLVLAASIGEAEFRRQSDRLADDIARKRARLEEVESALRGDVAAERSFEQARNLLIDFDRLYAAASYEQKRLILDSLTEALGGLLLTKDGLVWQRLSGRLAVTKESDDKKRRSSRSWRAVEGCAPVSEDDAPPLRAVLAGRRMKVPIT